LSVLDDIAALVEYEITRSDVSDVKRALAERDRLLALVEHERTQLALGPVRERAKAPGGRLIIASTPSAETEIRRDLPLDRTDRRDDGVPRTLNGERT
jgi:hypothetical protein